MNEKAVAKGFNRISAFYDFFVGLFFGSSIHRSQIHFFSELPLCKHALIIGGGTGQLLPPLLATKKVEQITFIDISAKMLEKAKKRKTEKDVIQFICGSHLDIPQKVQYDLIITPCFLDCFNQQEMQEVMQKLSSHHTENGVWLFSDFSVSQNSWFWKATAKIIIKTLYLCFNLTCKLRVKNLPNFKKAFERLNYITSAKAYFANGILQSMWLQKKAL